MLLKVLGETLLESAVVHASGHWGASTSSKLLHLRRLLMLVLVLVVVLLLLLILVMVLLWLILLGELSLRWLVELGLAHAIRVQAVLLMVRTILLGILLGKLMLARILLLLKPISRLLTARATGGTAVQIPLPRKALAGRKRSMICHAAGRSMSWPGWRTSYSRIKGRVSEIAGSAVVGAFSGLSLHRCRSSGQRGRKDCSCCGVAGQFARAG